MNVKFLAQASASDKIDGLLKHVGGTMRRRVLLLTSAFALIMSACAMRRARIVRLFLLENEHVRFDDGPELDLVQLRQHVRILKREEPRPNISLQPNKTAKYDFVGKVLSVFQEEEYGPHLGFTGMDQSN